MDDTDSFITLFARLGTRRATLLTALQAFDFDADATLHASDQQLLEAGLRQDAVTALRQPKPQLTNRCLAWLDGENRQLLRIDGDHYPELLRQIPDPPVLLFAEGKLEALQRPQVAVVGSRLCTAGGARTAQEFAAELTNLGLGITSGLAQGIDAAAHQGALAQQGSTLAVMGTGPDKVYPARHRKLATDIVENGLLLSEFPPGTDAARQNFPKRNRIISGLSLCTVVVEASLRSGSLITARLAAEQGRDVFAVPGSIHNPQARGCHHLIRQGAILAETVQQVVDELGNMLGYLESDSGGAASQPLALNQDEESLLRQIAFDPVSVDELSERSGLTIDKLSSILLALELKQVIESAPGGRIVRI